MSAQHTAGPWMAIPLEADFPGIGGTTLQHKRIVGANQISPGIVFGGLGDETDANAHLITASPDLYAVLKELLEGADWSETARESLAVRGLAAIAKAEGR